jgi:hypothetical protein
LNSTRILTVLGFTILPATVYGSGCSSGDDSGGGGPVTTEAGSRPIDGSIPSGDGAAGGGMEGAAMVTDMQCQSMTPTSSCITCCANLHSGSYLTFINAIVACECTSEAGTGVCQSQCATEYCNMMNPTPGDACDNCLSASLEADAGGRCLVPVANACPMGGPCDAYLLCANGCP